MFDYHLHSVVSYDGHNTPLEMARAAAAAGLKEICFTDHMDYQYSVPKEVYTYSVDAYTSGYEGLEIPGLTIRHGTEIGMTNGNREEVEADIACYPYDFVIGSVHFINDIDIYYPEFWEGRDFIATERIYYEEILRCVQAHDNFDVLGHLTYISKCKGHPNPRIIPLKDHKELFAEIMKALIAKGKGMEINTSGIDRCGDFLPGREYLELFRDLGGQVVTVGSDAHTTDRVGQYIGDALALAKDVFGHVCTFQNREPVFHKL